MNIALVGYYEGQLVLTMGHYELQPNDYLMQGLQTYL